MATSVLPLSRHLLTRKKSIQRHAPRLCVLIVWLLVSTPVLSQTIVESRQTYELIVDATIKTLSAPLGSWFDDREALKAAVFTSQKDQVSLRIENQPGRQHFTWLQKPSPAKQRSRQKTKKSSVLTVASFQDQSHSLMESIQRQYVVLIDAFRKGDEQLALATTGQLIHEVIDASLPSHVAIVEHDWSGLSATKLDKRIEKFSLQESKLLHAQHERFLYEVCVWPGRLLEMHDIPNAILESLLQASFVRHHDYSGAKESARSSVNSDERMTMRLRGQLDAATWLSGSLIRSAWREAGSPKLASQIKQATGNSISASGAVSNFVGSKQSKIFHKRTCPHVKRIKPANLIYFDDVAKARNVGRKTCKTCKPANHP